MGAIVILYRSTRPLILWQGKHRTGYDHFFIFSFFGVLAGPNKINNRTTRNKIVIKLLIILLVALINWHAMWPFFVCGICLVSRCPSPVTALYPESQGGPLVWECLLPAHEYKRSVIWDIVVYFEVYLLYERNEVLNVHGRHKM